MKNLPIDHPVRMRVSSRLKALRRERALTQEQLALRLSMGLKAIQRLESGHHNPTIDTLAHLARGLGVDVSRLLEADEGTGTTALSGLVRAGWRVRQPRQRRGRAVAVRSLQVGPAEDSPLGPVVAEALPPVVRQLNSDGLFLAQIDEEAMAPQVPAGSWCLFRERVAQPWVGRNLLFWLPEHGGWRLRRVASVEAPESGGWLVRLTARQSDVEPLVLSCSDLANLTVGGELMEVLQAA